MTAKQKREIAKKKREQRGKKHMELEIHCLRNKKIKKYTSISSRDQDMTKRNLRTTPYINPPSQLALFLLLSNLNASLVGLTFNTKSFGFTTCWLCTL